MLMFRVSCFRELSSVTVQAQERPNKPKLEDVLVAVVQEGLTLCGNDNYLSENDFYNLVRPLLVESKCSEQRVLDHLRTAVARRFREQSQYLPASGGRSALFRRVDFRLRVNTTNAVDFPDLFTTPFLLRSHSCTSSVTPFINSLILVDNAVASTDSASTTTSFPTPKMRSPAQPCRHCIRLRPRFPTSADSKSPSTCTDGFRSNIPARLS